MVKNIPKVAIVGRVNVGKSTLFNRIIRKPLAVVDSRPGITRDRIRKLVEHDGVVFEVIDTGGLFPPEEDPIWPVVRRHIEKAVRESDLVIFVVDLKSGLTPYDKEIAQWLRGLGKDVVLVANKSDIKRKSPEEFFELGFGEPILVAAAHGRGVDELLDTVVRHLKEQGIAEAPMEGSERSKIRTAIIGRPNVGKSSLLNSLLGEEVAVVSEVPGTTRDSVDIETDEFIFVDTAGIKRRFRDEIEYFSYLRSIRSLHFAEVAIVVIDVSQPITRMDKRIINLAIEEGRALVIALNKADLLDQRQRKELFPAIRTELAFVEFVPKVFTSAVTGENIDYLKVLVRNARREWSKTLKRNELVDTVERAISKFSPPYRIFNVKQIGVRPPKFAIVVERELPHHYLKYLERQLRMRFSFLGTPLVFEQIPKSRRKAKQ